ncbi:MAG: tRNA uridine-5-carboxymethylaminomethyl(34) synthesis GTPase MnmE [Aquificae bacterium]|nr:tRNA uridine-5-carboxymethylaminomethyl(34) synthesis GTPase MnmE [Aquificota bacterium]
MVEKKRDTIAAIATPYGESAIGVLRLSGPDTLEILKKVFRGRSGRLKPRFAHYGLIVDEGGEPIDEAVVVYYKGPHSYTGEDMAEISVHGNPIILKKVLERLLSAGARLAEPGEFTKRAFLNGKLDLTQAEAVAELISAKTDLARRLALNQLRGALSKEIKPLRDELLTLHALVESSIEFEEEDIPTIEREELKGRLERILERVNRLLETAKAGKYLRRGLKLAIVGRPNVGKSSLFNKLLGQERAIVTSVEGTTRDYLEETLSLGGVPIRLVDTAGIRKATDEVEKIGIERSLRQLEEADLVLFVLDASAQGLTPEELELAEKIARLNKPVLVVLNKADLGRRLELPENFPLKGVPTLAVSAKTGEGIEELKDRILEEAGLKGAAEGGQIYVSVRHGELLRRAKAALENALEYLRSDFYSPEILMLDLREATDALGEIVGEVTTEDVLGQIFSTFCIGK